jgi:hypothetical protein
MQKIDKVTAKVSAFSEVERQKGRFGRKRIELPADQEAEIVARTKRGESAETIFHAIKGALSKPTIERRQRELRGAKTEPKGVVKTPDVPPSDVPDAPADDTSIEQIDRWMESLETALAGAEEQENWSAVASLAQKAGTLLALRRKVAPLPQPDPNERPDYLALALQGEERFLKLVRGTFEQRDGFAST